jgi:hypothetical protein
MVRGWNSALGLLLRHSGDCHGVPLLESTSNTRRGAMTFLRQLGRSALLRESAEMIRSGMADACISEDRILLQMSERVSKDYFLDRLEPEKLTKLERTIKSSDPEEPLASKTHLADVEARMCARNTYHHGHEYGCRHSDGRRRRRC